MYAEIGISIVFGGLIYFVCDYIQQLLALRSYPPGPIPLPLLGNLHLLSDKPYESFRTLSKCYGDVFSISMGQERIVVVNSIESAKQALIRKGTDFAGRPTNAYHMNLMSRNGKDIAFADYGERWKTMRKIAHNSLKLYGSGMERIESLIIREVQCLEGLLNDIKEDPVDPTPLIGNAVVNIICAIVFGSRFQVNDPEFKDVIEFTNLVVQGVGNSDAVVFLPWLRFLPLEGLQKLKRGIAQRDEFLKRKLSNHLQTYNPKHIRDFTDAVIQHANNEFQDGCTKADWLTEDHMILILADVFVGGSETTTSTLRWALVYLVIWPETQKKAKEQLKAVIGKNKLPTLSQRKDLPYIEALTHEILRKSSLAPLGVPHKTITNTTIGDHKIPSGTQVLFNIWAFHNDERQWKNPDDFLPERWLDESDNFEVGKNTSYLPFQAGRRVCLGETMAKTELFLFLSYFIHNYDILPADPKRFPSLEGTLGITLAVKPYEVIFKKVNY